MTLSSALVAVVLGLCALGAEQWRVRRQWLRSGCFHGATVWRGAAPWPDKLRRVLTRAGADWLALCFDAWRQRAGARTSQRGVQGSAD